jgi:hypothetical protein
MTGWKMDSEIEELGIRIFDFGFIGIRNPDYKIPKSQFRNPKSLIFALHPNKSHP